MKFIVLLALLGTQLLGNISGYTLFNSAGSSMGLALPDQSVVIARKVTSLNVGNVIIFDHAGTLVCHQIVAIDGDMITTKGYANKEADRPIKNDSILFEVVGYYKGKTEGQTVACCPPIR